MDDTVPAIRKLSVSEQCARWFRVGELSGAILGKGKESLKQVRAWVLVRFRYKGALVGRSFHVGQSVSIGPGFIADDYVYVGPYSQLSLHVRDGQYSSLSRHVAIVGAGAADDTGSAS